MPSRRRTQRAPACRRHWRCGIANLPLLKAAPDIVLVADRAKKPIAEVTATYFAAEAFFQLDRVAGAVPGIVVSDYFDRLALDRALDSIGDAERRLTAAMVGNGIAGAGAVERMGQAASGRGRAHPLGDPRDRRLGAHAVEIVGGGEPAGGSGARISLVPEMPHAGKHHGDVVLVGGLDHLVVAHRAAGLDHRGGAGFDRHQQPSANGKNASDATTEPLVSGVAQLHFLRGVFRFPRRNARGIDAAHLSGADADGGETLGIDDGVRLHVLGDAEGKAQIGKLFLCSARVW